MLLKEYPEECVQNNARNWLKIQQDIAFVKKSLKGCGSPRREIVKSLLERRKSAENDKRLGLKSLPERDAALIGETLLAEPVSGCRQIQQRKRTNNFPWLNSCLLVQYHLIMAITLNKLRKWPIFCCPASLLRNESRWSVARAFAPGRF